MTRRDEAVAAAAACVVAAALAADAAVVAILGAAVESAARTASVASKAAAAATKLAVLAAERAKRGDKGNLAPRPVQLVADPLQQLLTQQLLQVLGTEAGTVKEIKATLRKKLDDFPVGDDFLLREAVEAGAALGAIARGILPFSRPYTREEITARWRCASNRSRVSASRVESRVVPLAFARVARRPNSSNSSESARLGLRAKRPARDRRAI